MRSIYVDKKIPKMLFLKMFGPLWPGLCWTPFSPVTVTDLPDPALPGDRWIKVKNRLCGICASDLSMLFVHVDPSVGPAALPGNRRFYLGHEVVGEVVDTGTGVARLRPGDRVVMDSRIFGPQCLSQGILPVCRFCADGDYGLCENISAGVGPRGVGGGWGDGYTAHESEVFPIPPDLSDDQAVLIEPMSIAMHGILRRPPVSRDQVLVAGAGAIGLFAVQAARAVCPDCRITAMVKHAHQAEAARRLGADHVIARSDGYAAAAKITGAKWYTAPMNKGMLLGGFDVIYDCVGSSTTVEDNLRWARAGGAVVLIGIDLRRIRVDLNPVWYQQVDLIGSQGHGMDAWQGQRRHTYEWVIDFIRSGKMKGDGLITHRFPFSDYKQAVTAAASKGKSGAIKVVFDYQNLGP